MYIYQLGRSTIDILFVCGTTLRCGYINWAAPTIDILFVCGLPSDEYQLGRSCNAPSRESVQYMIL